MFILFFTILLWFSPFIVLINLKQYSLNIVLLFFPFSLSVYLLFLTLPSFYPYPTITLPSLSIGHCPPPPTQPNPTTTPQSSSTPNPAPPSSHRCGPAPQSVHLGVYKWPWQYGHHQGHPHEFHCGPLRVDQETLRSLQRQSQHVSYLNKARIIKVLQPAGSSSNPFQPVPTASSNKARSCCTANLGGGCGVGFNTAISCSE